MLNERGGNLMLAAMLVRLGDVSAVAFHVGLELSERLNERLALGRVVLVTADDRGDALLESGGGLGDENVRHGYLLHYSTALASAPLALLKATWPCALSLQFKLGLGTSAARMR